MRNGKKSDFDAVAAEIVDDAAIGVDGDEIRLYWSARVDVQTVDDDLERVEESVDQRKRSRRHLSVRKRESIKRWIR